MGNSFAHEGAKEIASKLFRDLPENTKTNCNSRVISNLLMGDETWMHMFRPKRRADNKQ